MSKEALGGPPRHLIQAELDKVENYGQEADFFINGLVETEQNRSMFGERAEAALYEIEWTALDYTNLYEGELDPENPENGQLHQDWIEMRKKGRRLLEDAIAYHRILDFTVVRTMAVTFGAIPDPETDFQSYRDIDNSYRCWNCGEQGVHDHSARALV